MIIYFIICIKNIYNNRNISTQDIIEWYRKDVQDLLEVYIEGE